MFLTDDEVAQVCAPLVMPSAQLRYLRSLGALVHRKPNGRPLVARAELERVLVGRKPDQPEQNAGSQPNRAGLLQLFKGQRHGAQA